MRIFAVITGIGALLFGAATAVGSYFLVTHQNGVDSNSGWIMVVVGCFFTIGLLERCQDAAKKIEATKPHKPGDPYVITKKEQS